MGQRARRVERGVHGRRTVDRGNHPESRPTERAPSASPRGLGARLGRQADGSEGEDGREAASEKNLAGSLVAAACQRVFFQPQLGPLIKASSLSSFRTAVRFSYALMVALIL